MSASEIVAAHGLCRSLTQHHIDRLIGEGVPPMAMIRSALGSSSLMLRGRVLLSGRRFEFEPDHEAAVGAFVWPAFDEFGDAADLVAWRPSAPPALWRGACCMLGQELVFGPRFEPLRVHESTLDWLRAGRDGVVVVDEPMAASLLREAGGPLVVATAAHRRRLETMLTVKPPRIEVRATEPAIRLEAAE